MKRLFRVFKQTFQDFSEDECTQMAAALSYYTVFSLPPLLVIIVAVAGLVLDPQTVQQAIREQAGSLLGQEGARQISTMIRNAGRPGGGGLIALVLGIAGLLFGATGAFAQLQSTLNKAWEITPDPEQSGLLGFLIKRVFSLGMILVIAFLLLVSLMLSTALGAISGYIQQYLPGQVSQVALFAINEGFALLVITLLFAAIFKVLPDAVVRWRDLWIGAFVTALLFVVGKFAIGFYIGQSDPGSAFGAAGSLALLLVWVYYTSMIVFLGAEFTQAWAHHFGTGIKPEEGAVRVVRETKHVRDEDGETADRREEETTSESSART